MTYLQNNFYLTARAPLVLESGSYTVGSRWIPEGQDPENRAPANKTYNLDSDGKICFEMGNKMDLDLTRVFKGLVSDDNVIFGNSVSSASNLNFIFMGNLQLKFKNHPLIIFENIVIAREFLVPANAWWLGGQTCFNNNNGKVHAIGLGADKNYYSALLGCNNLNQGRFELYSLERTYPNWMQYLKDDNLSLRQLSIPGTHDSGTQLAYLFGAARCQNFSIRAQLYHGIRFFDIRLKSIVHSSGKRVLEVYHGIGSCDLTFEQVLLWCQAFLSKFNRETILMCVKKEGGDDITQLLETELSFFKNLFLQTNTVPKLGEARGKIVLFNRTPFNKFGIDWTRWGGTIQTREETFYIEDHYSCFDTNAKLSFIEESLTNANISQYRDSFFITFCSISWYFLEFTPYQSAWEGGGGCPAVNPSVYNFLSTQFLYAFEKGIRLGVVMLDYYNNEGYKSNDLVNCIIESNHATDADNGSYCILSKHSNLNVDVFGESTLNNQNVIMWESTGGLNQKFKFELQSNSTYRIIALHSNKCLEPDNPNEGAQLVQRDKSDSPYQLWVLVKSDLNNPGFVKIFNYMTGLCWDVFGNDTNLSVSVILYHPKDDPADNQKFRILFSE